MAKIKGDGWLSRGMGGLVGRWVAIRDGWLSREMGG